MLRMFEYTVLRKIFRHDNEVQRIRENYKLRNFIICILRPIM
jgi:hypothetical protein